MKIADYGIKPGNLFILKKNDKNRIPIILEHLVADAVIIERKTITEKIKYSILYTERNIFQLLQEPNLFSEHLVAGEECEDKRQSKREKEILNIKSYPIYTELDQIKNAIKERFKDTIDIFKQNTIKVTDPSISYIQLIDDNNQIGIGTNVAIIKIEDSPYSGITVHLHIGEITSILFDKNYKNVAFTLLSERQYDLLQNNCVDHKICPYQEIHFKENEIVTLQNCTKFFDSIVNKLNFMEKTELLNVHTIWRSIQREE